VVLAGNTRARAAFLASRARGRPNNKGIWAKGLFGIRPGPAHREHVRVLVHDFDDFRDRRRLVGHRVRALSRELIHALLLMAITIPRPCSASPKHWLPLVGLASGRTGFLAYHRAKDCPRQLLCAEISCPRPAHTPSRDREYGELRKL